MTTILFSSKIREREIKVPGHFSSLPGTFSASYEFNEIKLTERFSCSGLLRFFKGWGSFSHFSTQGIFSARRNTHPVFAKTKALIFDCENTYNDVGTVNPFIGISYIDIVTLNEEGERERLFIEFYEDLWINTEPGLPYWTSGGVQDYTIHTGYSFGSESYRHFKGYINSHAWNNCLIEGGHGYDNEVLTSPERIFAHNHQERWNFPGQSCPSMRIGRALFENSVRLTIIFNTPCKVVGFYIRNSYAPSICCGDVDFGGEPLPGFDITGGGVKDLKIYSTNETSLSDTAYRWYDDFSLFTGAEKDYYLLFDGYLDRHPNDSFGGFLEQKIPISFSPMSDYSVIAGHFQSASELTWFPSFCEIGHFSEPESNLTLDMASGHWEGYHLWGGLTNYFERTEHFRTLGKLRATDFFLWQKEVTCFYSRIVYEDINQEYKNTLLKVNQSLQAHWEFPANYFFPEETSQLVFYDQVAANIGASLYTTASFETDNYGNVYIPHRKDARIEEDGFLVSPSYPSYVYPHFIDKISSEGDLIWSVQGPSNEMWSPSEKSTLVIHSVAVIPDESYVYFSAGLLSFSVYVGKIDSDGNEIISGNWPLSSEPVSGVLNSVFDRNSARKLIYGRDGYLYLLASSYGGSCIPPNYNTYVYKIDPDNGDIIWTTPIPHTSYIPAFNTYDYLNMMSDIEVSSVGMVLVSGGRMDVGSHHGTFLLRWDGEIIDSRSWKGLYSTTIDESHTSSTNPDAFDPEDGEPLDVAVYSSKYGVRKHNVRELSGINDGDWQFANSYGLGYDIRQIKWSATNLIYGVGVKGVILNSLDGVPLYDSHKGGGNLAIPLDFEAITLPVEKTHKITVSGFSRFQVSIIVSVINTRNTNTVFQDAYEDFHPQYLTTTTGKQPVSQCKYNSEALDTEGLKASINSEGLDVLHGQGIEIQFSIENSGDWEANFGSESDRVLAYGKTYFPGCFIKKVIIDNKEFLRYKTSPNQSKYDVTGTHIFYDKHPLLGNVGPSVRQDHHIEIIVGWAYYGFYFPNAPAGRQVLRMGEMVYSPIVVLEDYFQTTGTFKCSPRLHIPITDNLYSVNMIGDLMPYGITPFKCGAGLQDIFSFSQGIRDVQIVKTLFDLGNSVISYQLVSLMVQGELEGKVGKAIHVVLNELSEGQEAILGLQTLQVTFENISQNEIVFNSFSEGINNIQNIQSDITDHGEAINQYQVIDQPVGIDNLETLVNYIVEGINNIQNIQSDITDHGEAINQYQVIDQPVGIDSLEVLTNYIVEGINNIQNIQSDITDHGEVINQYQVIDQQVGNLIEMISLTNQISYGLSGFQLNYNDITNHGESINGICQWL